MKARELEKRLLAEGWSLVLGRGKGSHRVYQHPALKKYIIIPWHKGKDIPLGLLRSILKQINVDGREKG